MILLYSINEFKIRHFIEKEYERLIEEENNYPKGTFRLWEKDRIGILNNLYAIKKDLMNQLCAFPVNYYLRSVKITLARAKVEQKLNEVDFAIKIFEMTNVFLHNDQKHFNPLPFKVVVK